MSKVTKHVTKLKKLLRETEVSKETLLRVATETTSWRLSVLFIITPAITYAVTHKLKFSVELPVVELTIKYPLQILHGKLWSHIPWGYKTIALNNIMRSASSRTKQSIS